MHIVLYQPEIPQNSGNISRTCAATNTTLHLVEPLGFSLDERHLRRAGLDYWHLLDVHVHKSWEDCERALGDRKRYYLSTKASRRYADIAFSSDDCLIFGPETRSLPEEMLKTHRQNCLRIPIISQARSLNLSNAVAIVLFEALRQQEFTGLSESGTLG